MNNPYYNAVLAAGYIFLIVGVIMTLGTFNAGADNFLSPIMALSLLVLSVATMGFLFFYRPLVMIIDGAREAAVGFFFRTLGTFAVIIALLTAASAVLFD